MIVLLPTASQRNQLIAVCRIRKGALGRGKLPLCISDPSSDERNTLAVGVVDHTTDS
jgi:hypothetical protein